jgi:hypothetical protein
VGRSVYNRVLRKKLIGDDDHGFGDVKFGGPLNSLHHIFATKKDEQRLFRLT